MEILWRDLTYIRFGVENTDFDVAFRKYKLQDDPLIQDQVEQMESSVPEELKAVLNQEILNLYDEYEDSF